jgi:hypothetical protein
MVLVLSVVLKNDRYAATPLEALTLVWRVQRYKHHLAGSKAIVYTDHASLQFVFRIQSHLVNFNVGSRLSWSMTSRSDTDLDKAIPPTLCPVCFDCLFAYQYRTIQIQISFVLMLLYLPIKKNLETSHKNIKKTQETQETPTKKLKMKEAVR